MEFKNPMPNGELQGDTKPMPDRGTGTGMPGNAMTMGRSLDPSATNRLKSIRGATQSDEMFDTSPGDEGMRGDRD